MAAWVGRAGEARQAMGGLSWQGKALWVELARQGLGGWSWLQGFHARLASVVVRPLASATDSWLLIHRCCKRPPSEEYSKAMEDADEYPTQPHHGKNEL